MPKSNGFQRKVMLTLLSLAVTMIVGMIAFFVQANDTRIDSNRVDSRARFDKVEASAQKNHDSILTMKGDLTAIRKEQGEVKGILLMVARMQGASELEIHNAKNGDSARDTTGP